MTAGSLAKAETQLPRGLGSKNRLDAIDRQRQSDVTSLTSHQNSARVNLYASVKNTTTEKSTRITKA